MDHRVRYVPYTGHWSSFDTSGDYEVTRITQLSYIKYYLFNLGVLVHSCVVKLLLGFFLSSLKWFSTMELASSLSLCMISFTLLIYMYNFVYTAVMMFLLAE